MVPVTSLDKVKLRIFAVIEIEYRLSILRATKDAHVEVVQHSAVLNP
jgi:hypothetical protein